MPKSDSFGYLIEYEKKCAHELGYWMRENFKMVHRILDSGEVVYDSAKAEQAIQFIEKYLSFVEGKAGKFKLELWQKYIVACIYGLVDPEDGYRHFTEFVLVMGRKQGKSTLVAALETCTAYTQDELGMQIYNLAPLLDQAGIIYQQVLAMIMGNKRLKKLGVKRRDYFEIPHKRCIIKRRAFQSKKSDGFNPYFVCYDEFAAWPGAKSIDMYNVMTSGQGSRRDPINIACSTANFESDGLYDELYMRSTNVLKGTAEEDTLLPFLYMIDDPDKWDDIDELKKALPNLGVSFLLRNLKKEIRIAHSSDKKKREFITKYCNLKQNATGAWLSDAQIRSSIGPAFDMEMFAGMAGMGGVDLSQTTDLTSACILINYDGIDYVISHFWMPANKIKDLSQKDNFDYDLMVKHGFLSLSGENFVNYKDVTAWFDEMKRKYRINVLMVGYDRYSSTYFVDEMNRHGYKTDDVIQGTNLTPILNEFEGLLSDGKIKTGNNGLLQSHFRNAAIQFVTNDNRLRLTKIDRTKHIDGLAALIDAMTVRSKYLDKWKHLLFGNKIRQPRKKEDDEEFKWKGWGE